jgi:PAS domain S-box-containing protein
MAGMLGYLTDEMAGRALQGLLGEQSNNFLKNTFGAPGKMIMGQFDLKFCRKDGTGLWTIFSATPIFNKAGNYAGLMAIVMDITERKRMEEASLLMASIVASSDDAIIGKTLDGVITSWNAGATKLYGYAAEEVIGKPISILMPPDSEDELPNILNRIKHGERIEHFETLRRRKDGKLINVSISISPIEDADGNVFGASTIARDITERKRAEEAIQFAGAYNRSLIEASLDPLVTIAPDGAITDVNKATEAATGYPREKLIGTHFSNYFTDPVKAKEGYLKVFETGSVMDYPLEIRHRDGHIVPVLYNASVYKDEAGKVIGVFAAARDITERRHAEEAARLASAYNRSLIEASLDPLVTISPDGTITDVNEATEKVTGFSREWLVGTDFSNYFSNPGKAKEGYLQAFKEGTVKDYPLEIGHSDGHMTPVLYNASVYKDEAGKVIGVFAAARDISERKRAEETARIANAYNRSLIEASLDPLVTISPDGVIMDVNEATEKVTGYSRDDLIGTDFSIYFTEPIKAKEGYLAAFKEGSVTDYPLQLRRRDGHLTPVIYNASVYRDEAGKVIGVFAAARDITERKRAEEAVRLVNAYNRSLIEASLDPLVTIAPDGKITDVNIATETITGYSRNALIGTDFSNYFTEPVKAREGYLKAFEKGSVKDYPLEIRNKNGRLTPVNYNASVYRDEAGKVIGVFAAARDMAVQKQAEEAVHLAYAYNRSLIEASLDPLVTISPDGVITDVNKATEKVTGTTREKLIGTDFSNYFTEPEKAKEGYLTVFKEGSVTDYPLEIRRSDGHVTPVIYNASVYKDEAGRVIGVFAAARDISEQEKIEEARLRLAAIVDSSDDAIIGKTLDGIITSWNAGAMRLYGYSEDEVLGKSISILATPDYPDEIPGILEKIRHGEHIDHYETMRKRKDGSIINISLSVSPIKDSNGQLVGASTITRDITEKKQAEEAIRLASLYNRSLIEASLDPLVTISPDGVITDVNVATEKVTGFSRDKLIGTDFSNYFTEPEKAKEGYLTVFKEGSVTDYPLEIRHRDGRVTPVIYNASVYRDEAGKVIGVFAAARDITERKRAEEVARVASAYNRKLIEASLDPLVTIAPNGEVTDVNVATETITGFSRDKLIGTDFSNYFTEPEKAKEGYLTVFKEGSVTDYPLEIRHRDGHVTPVIYNASVYKDEDDNIIGVFAAARDITERKRAEEAVKQANAYNRSLIEASLDPLVTIAPDGKITDVNEATEKVTGYSRDELIGTDFSDYFTEPDKAREGYLQVFKEGIVTDYALKIRHRSGNITPVVYNASVYSNEAGSVIGVFAAARDVTELNRAEEALKQKMAEVERSNAELEQFAYVASHDLQEPLRMVASYVKLLDRRYKDKLDADASEFINYAVEGSTRMQQMINDLLAYSRVGTKGMPFEPVDLELTLKRALGNLKASISESDARVTYDPLPTVMADDIQLTQLFQNLIGNAIKFRSADRSPIVHVSAKRLESAWEFVVSDNGIGIEPEYFDRIFIIFHRLHTRVEYPGSGIGLAICKKIVERHGGRIWVESKPGVGSMFHFTIPIRPG